MDAGVAFIQCAFTLIMQQLHIKGSREVYKIVVRCGKLVELTQPWKPDKGPWACNNL